jgi:hypothetical protein
MRCEVGVLATSARGPEYAKAPLEFTRDAGGLHLTLPEGRSSGWAFTFDYVFTFEISGQGLVRG